QRRHKDDYSRVEFARQSFEARPSRCYNLKRDEAKAMAAQPNPDGGAPAGAGERPIHEPVWHYRGYDLRPQDFTTAMVHFYRGEIQRANTWRNRLDTTRNWAIVTTAGVISFALAAP